MVKKTKEKQRAENIAEKLTEEQQNVVNLALKGKIF